MNRASSAAAFDWLRTANREEIEAALDVIAANPNYAAIVADVELLGESPTTAQQNRYAFVTSDGENHAPPTDGSPLVLHDFGFCGMARYLEQQGHDTEIGRDPMEVTRRMCK